MTTKSEGLTSVFDSASAVNARHSSLRRLEMKSIVRRSLTSGRPTNHPSPRWDSFATGRIVVMLSGVLLSSFGIPPARAQGTVSAKAPVSPEAMAMHVQAKRPVARSATTLEPAVSLLAASSTFNSAQGPGAGAIGPGPGCDLFPAPPSVGASVPSSYFAPPPSTPNPSLVGPVQLLNSGTVDAKHGTITIPFHNGRLAGTTKPIWYVLTDVDESSIAAELGLNFSAKLTFASQAARVGNLDADGNIVFNKGTVNFAPKRSIVPGSAGAEFPPKSFAPGSIGGADYSPFVRIVNAGNVIYNAPMVAFDVDANQINF